MAAKVCKNGVLDVFSSIYSFQFRIKMHGLNEFKIIYDHIWAEENIYMQRTTQLFCHLSK